MGFIGVQPASVPLTASDITNDIINADKIADNSISEEHLDATVITGLSELAEAPADTDEFLISDGGVLKRIDASFIGGGLVQVVQGTYDSMTSTSSHNTMVDMGLNVNITPSSSSNKVLCFFNVNLQPNGDGYSGGISIVRGSTAIRTGSSGQNRGTAQIWSGEGSNNKYHMNHFTGMVLDSPSTTSQTNYKVQFASGYSGQTVYVNRNYSNVNHFDSTCTIVCMEISV